MDFAQTARQNSGEFHALLSTGDRNPRRIPRRQPLRPTRRRADKREDEGVFVIAVICIHIQIT